MQQYMAQKGDVLTAQRIQKRDENVYTLNVERFCVSAADSSKPIKSNEEMKN